MAKRGGELERGSCQETLNHCGMQSGSLKTLIFGKFKFISDNFDRTQHSIHMTLLHLICFTLYSSCFDQYVSCRNLYHAFV